MNDYYILPAMGFPAFSAVCGCLSYNVTDCPVAALLGRFQFLIPVRLQVLKYHLCEVRLLAVIYSIVHTKLSDSYNFTIIQMSYLQLGFHFHFLNLI